ncbi:MAG: DUF4124 domain-containing protein [Azoarcus sp.]|nr:DUF4124 domain-containing protein [Azoarcus sp.]
MLRGYDGVSNYQCKLIAMLPAAAAILIAALVSTSADAQVYKCKEDSTGKVTFSDVPCHGKNAGGSVNLHENTLDTSGSREQALKREIRDLQERMDSYEAAGSSRSQYGRTESDLQAERADSHACKQAKWSLDIEAGSMTRNKASVASKEAAMRSACGMREPDRVEIHNEYGRRGSSRAAPPRATTITNCDSGGCWDNAGGRYNRGAGNTYFPAAGGGACQMINGRMQCP